MFLFDYFFMSHSATFWASSFVLPQNKMSALNPSQTSGREGSLKIAHRKSSVRCKHFNPAGLPFGIPGIGELIEI